MGALAKKRRLKEERAAKVPGSFASSQVAGTDTARNNVHINVMFPSSEVELPAPERFNAFPEDARAAIIEGFRVEQAKRHAWIERQQANDHASTWPRSSSTFSTAHSAS